MIIEDPIELEVWRHLLAAVTEEMGVVLTKSAFSPNIKERRDLSCALFSPSGDMAAHAAHIPVHLGSTPMAVRAVLDELRMEPGDVALVNDPYRGGTHLPDITVVAPVHLHSLQEPSPIEKENRGPRRARADERLDHHRLLGYVVNRAHHADVGGTFAGSMGLARHIDEEGVRLPPLMVVRHGELQESLLHDRLYRHVRTPLEREGDILAQLASARAGAKRLLELAKAYGPDTVQAAMQGLVTHAERMMRARLASLPDGRFEAKDILDDDGIGDLPISIEAAITIRGEEAEIDFSGTSSQVEGPLNAVLAVTASSVLYVLRCIAPEDIPASSGLLRPIRLSAPKGTVVNAVYPAPVAGGNVETSQRIVDVLFAALAKALPAEIPAASQGTMNNVALGGIKPAPWAYYETLGGGTGAGPGFDGESAIHSHMTNTLNTPVEALEHCLPLRVEALRIRRSSGGNGLWHGGDGLERHYRFLVPTEITLLADRRRHPPPGLGGGDPGAVGEHLLIRKGHAMRLPGKTVLQAMPDDLLVVRTPGGGGFGTPSKTRGSGDT